MLSHRLKKAEAIIDRWPEDQRWRLDRQCRQIRVAQQRLRQAARPALSHCATVCAGLCCRNVHAADLIGLWDLVFILASRPHLAPRLAQRFEAMEVLYRADCTLLADGTGPCLLPEDIRPQLWAVSFCTSVPGIIRTVARLKWQFAGLHRLYWRTRFSIRSGTLHRTWWVPVALALNAINALANPILH